MKTHTNPVWPGYLADPFAWYHEGFYYAVGTGPAGEGGARFPLLCSEDLVNWRALGHALAAVDPALGDDFWAPEVAFDGGKFYLYYSVGRGDVGHHLRVAVSERPEGPFVDAGKTLNDRAKIPFAIDAHPFRDDDGQWYLFYARDFLDCEGGFRAGTGLVVDRLIDMTRLAGEETTVMRARHDWQVYELNRPIHGGIYDWHTLEGATVRKRDGVYYCFYSGGCWQNETYGVDYAVADRVCGPYLDTTPNSGPRVLRTLPGKVTGPGHNSIVTTPEGEDYLVYHAWNDERTARQMCVDRLAWTEEGPRCPDLEE